MTFSHADIEEHLVGFLYGELDGDLRAAFEDHVKACAQCRSDVEAFQKTRSTARAVVRAPLAEPIPEAVRARVMEVVTRAAAERASIGAQSRHPVAVASASGAQAVPRWLAWLRARWTIPMFATVAAMAALLLVRETIFREARHPLAETSPSESAPGRTPQAPSAPPRGESAPKASEGRPTAPEVSLEPAGVPRPTRDKVEERPVRPLTVEPMSGAAKRRPRPPASAGAQAGPPPAPKAVMGTAREWAKAPAKADDGAAPDQDPERVHAGALRSATKGRDDQATEGLLEGASPASASAPVEAPGTTSRYSQAAEEESDLSEPARSQKKTSSAAGRGSGSPTTKPTVASAERANAAAAAQAQSRARTASVGNAPPGPPPPPATQPAAPPVVPKVSRAAADSPESSTSRAPPRTPSQAPADLAKAAPDPASVLSDRADKLAAAHRWSEAIAAYRDLLKQFPRHPSVPTWRNRLATAQSAAAAEADSSQFAAPPPR
jgi:hypothetical protein